MGQGSGKAVDGWSDLRAQGYTAFGQIHPQGLFSKLLCLMPLVSRHRCGLACHIK